MSIPSIIACGKRVACSLTGYSTDGSLGLFVREDNAAETGVRDGSSAAITEAAGSLSRTAGVVGVIGNAVSRGVTSGVQAGTQKKPVLVEEGREILFMSAS
jgi:hypothetical protein